MPPPANQVELATGMRMKGVRDVNLKAGRIHTTCSRRHSPKPRSRSPCGIVTRFVLAKLRNRRFFSLVELNDAIRDCVATINAKVMKQSQAEPQRICSPVSTGRR